MKIFFVCSLELGSIGQASPTEPVQSLNPLKQQGQLVSVEIVLGQPMKILVVGREEAQLDLSKLKLVVKRLAPRPTRDLKVRPQAGHFIISDALNSESAMNLEVTTEIPDKSETFHFNLNRK